MAFKFRVEKDLHLTQPMFDLLCQARNSRCHGPLKFVDIRSDKCIAHFVKDGCSQTVEMDTDYDGSGEGAYKASIMQCVERMIHDEPELRRQWKLEHGTVQPTPRAERFAKEDSERKQ